MEDGNIKWKFIFATVIIFLISLSYASAVDTNQTDIITENNVLSVSTNENFNGTTFSELNTKIGSMEDGDTLNLTKNVTQDTTSAITIGKSITLNGNGYVIDANKVSGIFTITANNVTLNNITFINSKTAISWNGANGNINGCIFINNKGTNGGIINWLGSNGKINGSTFINNSASYYGGAIYWQGLNGIIEESNFTNNDASTGGAIYWQGKQATINNSKFENNNAKSFGGAIHSASQDSTINECEFENNSANYGGGIYLNARNSNINKSKFKNNSANYGGAIDLYNDYETINDCDFENNIATRWGGAVYVSGNYNVINNSQFKNNTADLGGAICSVAWDTTINGSAFEGNNAESYRHVYLDDLESIVENSTFESIITIEEIDDCSVTSNITINATFDDGTNFDGYSVVFYNNGEVITELAYDESNIYQYQWNNLAAGNYSITVNAKNDKGNIYNASYNPIEFEVYKYNSTVTINPISSVVYNESVEVNFTIENQTFALYEIKDHNGHIVRMGIIESDDLIIDDLYIGNYTITITNYENSIYSGSNASADFSVNDPRIKTEIALDIETGENIATITVNVNPNATGLVKFKITNGHEQTFYLELDNGTATIPELYMEAGDYNIDVTYFGDDNYTPSTATDNFTIIDKLIVTVQDVVKYFHGSEKLIVNVTRSDVPISNATVEITINGVTYTRITDENGTTSLAINLNSGKYTADVKVNDTLVNATVTVLPTIYGEDITKVCFDGTTYNVILLDSEGNYLKEGTTVTFNINGVIYESKTIGDEGFASLDVDLEADKYIITATNSVTGENTINNITILKAESDIIVQAHNINVTDVDIIIADIILPDGATGNVTVTIGNNTTIYDISSSEHIDRDGKTVMFIHNNGLKAGEYNISATYEGNGYFNPSSNNDSFNVSKVDVSIKTDLNETAMTVTFSENATGNITLTINNETFVSPIENGTAIFDLTDIPYGEYNATLTYAGDDTYNGMEVNIIVPIEDSFEVIVENLTKYYNGPERFTVQVVDKKGNPIVNTTVEIVLNGISYNRTTDNNGTASMAINLNSGEYPVVVNYNSTSTNATITVLPTVNGTDVVKVFRNATQYYATFLDSEGNYLKAGTIVTFNINGVFYNRTISGDKGLAKLNINLEQGEYIITAINLETGEKTSNNITVLSRLIENKDITKYFKNGTHYTVKVIGDDGKAVGAGVTVKFNINGVFYERQTNESGIVKLNLNLVPGEYIITAEYEGCKVSNNIKILPVLTAEDLTKKYGANDPFEAKLVDGEGKPYENQKILFNINGVLYYRTTDSAGIAKLDVNLQVGEYIITSQYDEARISNKITITS